MYTVTTRQQTDGTFTTLDTCETRDEAIDSAKCEVDGQPGYSVYVFCDEMIGGRTYPYLVAKVTYETGRWESGPVIGWA